MARARRPTQALERRVDNFHPTNCNESQPPPNYHPEGVGTDRFTPAPGFPDKRKPELANEGKAPNKDRKRTKKHSIPAHQNISGKSPSEPAFLYPRPTMQPIRLTAGSIEMLGISPQMLYTSATPVCVTKRAPADASSKVVSLSPRLELPPATKTISHSPLHPARKSSYERRHGGPRFRIYGDDTETYGPFSLGSDDQLFQWDLVPSGIGNGVDSTGNNQENDVERYRDNTVLRSTGEHVARFAGTDTGDVTVVQRSSKKARPQVSKQALDVLRMMR